MMSAILLSLVTSLTASGVVFATVIPGGRASECAEPQGAPASQARDPKPQKKSSIDWMLPSGLVVSWDPQLQLFSGSAWISLRGPITAGDAARVPKDIASAEASLGKPNSSLWVNVSSEGGDVQTAMAIGRFLRQRRATVFVQADSECLSSCVLLLAAGSDRLVYGKVGIHRPYLPDARGQSAASLQEYWRQTKSQLRIYFEEMNVPRCADLLTGAMVAGAHVHHGPVAVPERLLPGMLKAAA